ncbi:hypothetical protein ACH5RR_004417 [Cinchona calisaya]|uniref:Uncharacterized protein n=1 Tax=Cinchona calisaya TaxID=153742 RepID=A0ABD3AXY9_9GENT
MSGVGFGAFFFSNSNILFIFFVHNKNILTSQSYCLFLVTIATMTKAMLRKRRRSRITRTILRDFCDCIRMYRNGATTEPICSVCWALPLLWFTSVKFEKH